MNYTHAREPSSDSLFDGVNNNVGHREGKVTDNPHRGEDRNKRHDQRDRDSGDHGLSDVGKGFRGVAFWDKDCHAVRKFARSAGLFMLFGCLDAASAF